jgi:hypothetical protein
LCKGVTYRGIPSAHWQTDNTAVWPDEAQLKVARSRNLDEPLFVYNMNKYKPAATYLSPGADGQRISGERAYGHYARIAGFELLRRGAFPVYGGKPIGLLEGREDCMLADRWDKFIFVRYPQRRNLLATIVECGIQPGPDSPRGRPRTGRHLYGRRRLRRVHPGGNIFVSLSNFGQDCVSAPG